MITFDELIADGWQRHADDAPAVAALLEQHAALAADATQAAALLRLSNHTMGEHLRDWPRAARFAAGVVSAVPGAGAAAGPLIPLAVARFMSGTILDALATQARIVALDAGQATAVVARIGVEVAANSLAIGVVDEGKALYECALALARTHADAATVRSIAIVSNNLASDLLARTGRTDAATRLMLDVAHAAREFWMKCGTRVNEARADYLLALVYNAVGQPGTARGHGEHALALLEAHGDEKVDEAFTNLALAHSARLTGDQPGYHRHLAQADGLAAAFADAGLEQWFAEERRKVVPIGAPG